MFTLRPYQQNCVDAGVRFFTNNRVVKPKILVAPTAAGKSIIIAAIASQLEGNILILQPTKELLGQNFMKYMKYDRNAEIYSASFNRKKLARVTFATIGSITRVAELFTQFNHLIIDEAHLYPASQESMFGKFLTINPQLKILGLTATPFRLHTGSTSARLVMMHNRHIYNGYAHIIQIQDIVNFWSPLKYLIDGGNKSLLKAKNSGIEYTDESLEKYFLNIEEKVMLYARRYADRRTLIFVPSVKMADKLAKLLPGSASVSALTDSKERDRIINGFKSGRILTVFNVNVLSVGFDYPELEVLIDAVPTMSLARHYQKIGRLTRVHKDKEFGLVVDLSGNTEKFGKIEDLEIRPVGGSHHVFSGGRQLTGVDLTQISFPIAQREFVFEDIMFDFGQYKGKRITEITDKRYLSWVMDNFTGRDLLVKNIKHHLTKAREIR
jgi:DNA repair protein RadD